MRQKKRKTAEKEDSAHQRRHDSLHCSFFASIGFDMHNSTGHVIKQLVHAFSCALSSYGTRGKFGEHSRS